MKCYDEKDEKRNKLLEACFDCFCEHGLENTSTRMLADACGMTSGNLFNHYFDSKDQIVIECTAYGMARVEDDFMASAPRNVDEVEDYLRKMPYITAEKHGAKYRFMYQVYSSPRYLEYGRQFSKTVVERYTEYAALLEVQLGAPKEVIQPLIYFFVQACIYYSMFENEAYMLSEINLLVQIVNSLKQQYVKGNVPPQIDSGERPASPV